MPISSADQLERSGKTGFTSTTHLHQSKAGGGSKGHRQETQALLRNPEANCLKLVNVSWPKTFFQSYPLAHVAQANQGLLPSASGDRRLLSRSAAKHVGSFVTSLSLFLIALEEIWVGGIIESLGSANQFSAPTSHKSLPECAR